MFERKVWTIFHVFLIYSIECPLHLWFQMCKMFKKIWICDKQSGNKWNFHHLFQRTLCTCFLCSSQQLSSIVFNSLFGSLWFLFCWTICWKQFPSPLVHLSVELEFKRPLSKVERKQDSGLFLLQCWKGDCLINCLQIFASRGKNWQKTWSSAAQNITTPDTTQQ